MVDRNIITKLGLSEEQLERQVNEMFTEKENQFLEEVLKTRIDSRQPGSIIKGTIVSQIGNDVIVEIGLKSEGVVDAGEFNDPEEIVPGREIEVFLEDSDTSNELIALSKHKADRIRNWETLLQTKKEGDTVTGMVIRRIKGGLLVDIGVPVFLPASQVDIRRPGDISRFIGKEIKSVILKIDVENRNIVISRRKLIEEQRQSSKEKILKEIEPGQLRKGVVKNIADFGVFVDLGGLDGLLHISDLSWGRISHPSEVVKLDETIECFVIGVDKANEKVSLGLKQKTTSPWENVESNYPIGSRVKGTIVNIMNYGVFVRLEDGIEGLIHISEMSWTKRLSHPTEMLNIADEVEAVVLSVNKGKQEISLGLKQTEINPWTIASQKYPPGTVVTAKVRSLTNFGAFVEIEEGIAGMIHVSDLSWTRKYGHPSEALEKGGQVECVVLEVDQEKQRISLGVKELTEDPWVRAIPEKYIPGHIIKGKVIKLTNFGAFVELEPELEGLLHISELADHKIKKPQDIVDIGDEVEVKILRVDPESRKIGLSLRRARWAAEEQQVEAAAEDQKLVDEKGEPAGKTDTGSAENQQDKPEAAETESAPDSEKKPDKVDDDKKDKQPGDADKSQQQQAEQQVEAAAEDQKLADEKGEAAGKTDAGSAENQQDKPEAAEIESVSDSEKKPDKVNDDKKDKQPGDADKSQQQQAAQQAPQELEQPDRQNSPDSDDSSA